MVKDNTTKGGISFYVDKDDFSIARGLPYYFKLFKKAGYDIIFQEHFKEFSDECMPVWKIVLRPSKSYKVPAEFS